MSVYPALSGDSAVPTLALNAPIEIWQEIIDQVLFDPILSLVDPFYPGCNLHTALAEWHDINRSRRQDAQRGILRLVARSWKILTERSPWQAFEPCRSASAAKQLSRLRLTRRLKMQPTCTACDALWQDGDELCDICWMRDDALYITHELLALRDPTSIEILYYPLAVWNINHHSVDIFRKNFYQYTPKLRALFIGLDRLPKPDVIAMFSKLTTLGLRVTGSLRGLKEDIVLSSVVVLQLRVADYVDCDFLTRWKMPRLAHLDIASTSEADILGSLYEFLVLNGAGLISLCLRFFDYEIDLFENIWELLPLLQYIGLSTLVHDLRVGRPPRGHPLRTFAILEGKNEVPPYARYDVWESISDWDCLAAIADCHDWSDIPPGLVDNEDNDEPGFEHNCSSRSCAKCIVHIRFKCILLGLRYEDCKGRTLSEFTEQRSQFEKPIYKPSIEGVYS